MRPKLKITGQLQPRRTPSHPPRPQHPQPTSKPATKFRATGKLRGPMKSPAGNTFDRSEQELREMAKRHIAFEVKMLREMSSALRGGPVSPKALRNALVETFLIHYRNLYDFLFPDYPRRTRLRDDVDAGDYVPDPKQWRNHRPEWLRHYAEHRTRMNTQLAHLSYKRLRYDTRSWPDQKMAHRIEAAWHDFLSQLPSQRKRWFKAVADSPAGPASALPMEATPALTAQATLELTAPQSRPLGTPAGDPKPAPNRKRRPSAA